jgi:hypothetical protein
MRSTSRYSLLVIENWDTYQTETNTGNQHSNHDLTTSQPGPNHDLTTEEEVKKLRREEEDLKPCPPDGGRMGEFPPVPSKAKPIRGMTPQQEGWFVTFWGQYWRRGSKKDGRAAFQKHVRNGERFEVVMRAIEGQRPEMLSRDETKRPLPATWLNAERWEDEALPARRTETQRVMESI